jgi:Ca2+-binding RTX toxin-like protein
VQSSITYTLGDNVENLTLTESDAIDGTGNDLDNIVTGNSAANTLDGGEGADTLDGGAGADTMLGGAGDDVYVVDDTGDVVTELTGDGTDLVQSEITYTLGDYVENLTLTGSGVINGYGNSLDNELTGNSAANTLDGGEGADTLDGGAGADTMLGGAGDDVYVVDDAGDVVAEATDGQFENFDFSQGTAGETVILGWTIVNERVMLDGTSTLAGWATVVDSSTAPNGGTETSSYSGGTFTTTLSSETQTSTGLAVNLTSTLSGVVNTPISGIGGVLHGPAIYSNNAVTLSSGDLISFDWKAEGGDDAFDVYGYIVDVDTGSTELLLDETGDSASDVSPWQTVSHTVTTAGNYKFVFVSGSWDATGGEVAGASPYIDNVITLADGVEQLTGVEGGTDLVQSTLSYSLTGGVENLTLMGSAAIDGNGNALENILIGNSAANTLDGGLGSDSLTGGSGQDQFVFSTSLNSTTNVDTLLDFQTGTDSIVLSEAVFSQLADLDIGSSPSVDNLLIGDAALDANDYLLYNSSTGVLSYDADGSGTASAAVAFAKIELNGVPPTDLSATDFIISA